jgi:hypothetical protein
MLDGNTTKSEAAARLMELIQIRLISEAIHVAAALGIADLLNDGPQGAEQLAETTGANALSLRRVMRALTSFGVFSQDSAGRFALAPMGQLLKRDTPGSLNAASLLSGGEFGARTVQLFLECVKTGENANQKLCGGNWMESLQRNPEQVKVFNAAMTALSTLHFTGVLAAYDFSQFKRLVDVGGGYGTILTEIVKSHPEMRGILFDRPHAFEGGQRTVALAGLADRCEIVSGDFFVSVPAGGDGYLLSRVIHDWDDDKAVAILKVIRTAIAPHGKLVLLENMLKAETDAVYPILSDLNMLIHTGGCERTEVEYGSLYRAAGFQLTKAIPTKSPTGTTVIEGKPI